MTIRLMNVPSLSLPATMATCPLCNGDKYVEQYTNNHRDPSETKRVECSDCEGMGEVEQEVEFVVFDGVRNAYVGWNEELQKVCPVQTQEEASEYSNWGEAHDDVCDYLKEFGLGVYQRDFQAIAVSSSEA